MAENSCGVKEIGGYFGLELRGGNHYHAKALRLNTARNCFEYILRVRGYKKVYVPFYTCEVMFKTLQKCGVRWEFYAINSHLEPVTKVHLDKEEGFLYTNYFGLKQLCVSELSEYYGSQLLVDNAQAFFDPPIAGIDTFYSARKYFGVADGAYLYIDKYLDLDIERDYSSDRMSHLLGRWERGAEYSYPDFVRTESELDECSIKHMSILTERILKSIDYEFIKERRRFNYKILDFSLSQTNKIDVSLSDSDVPMIYPYFQNQDSLRANLISKKIFVATYWKSVLGNVDKGSFEYKLVNNLIPLPIDQRYDKNSINQYLKIINV